MCNKMYTILKFDLSPLEHYLYHKIAIYLTWCFWIRNPGNSVAGLFRAELLNSHLRWLDQQLSKPCGWCTCSDVDLSCEAGNLFLRQRSLNLQYLFKCFFKGKVQSMIASWLNQLSHFKSALLSKLEWHGFLESISRKSHWCCFGVVEHNEFSVFNRWIWIPYKSVKIENLIDKIISSVFKKWHLGIVEC